MSSSNLHVILHTLLSVFLLFQSIHSEPEGFGKSNFRLLHGEQEKEIKNGVNLTKSSRGTIEKAGNNNNNKTVNYGVYSTSATTKTSRNLLNYSIDATFILNSTSSWNSSCSNSSNCSKSTKGLDSIGDAKSLTFSDKLAIFVFGFVCIVGVFGNAFVCYTFGYKCRARRTVTEALLLYLAIADLIASLFNPLLYIYWIATGFRRWDFGMIGCKILPPIGPISTTASASIIILICIDRYRSIVTPFKTRLNITQINIMAMLLMIVTVLSYTFYIVKLDLVPGMTCLPPDVGDKEYTIPYIGVTLVFDSVYIAIFVPSYIRIFYQLRAKDDLKSGTTFWENRRKGTRKVLRMLFTVGVVFAILVFPRDITQLVYSFSWMFPPGLPRSKTLVTLNYWLKLLHVSNSCANIFIYSHMHDNFKKELKSLFKKLFKKRSFNSDEMVERGTSVEHSEITSSRSRANSLLHILSFKHRAHLKDRRRSDHGQHGNRSPVSVSPNLVKRPGAEKEASPVKLSPNLAQRLAADQEGSPVTRSPNLAKRLFNRDETGKEIPINLSPNTAKTGHVTFNDDVMKRIQDALSPSPAKGRGASPPQSSFSGCLGGEMDSIKAYNKSLDFNEDHIHSNSGYKHTSRSRPDFKEISKMSEIAEKSKPNLHVREPCFENEIRSFVPQESGAANTETYPSPQFETGVNVRHERIAPDETPRGVLKDFSTSKVFGLNTSILHPKSNINGSLQGTSLLTDTDDLISETEELLNTHSTYDVKIDNHYSEAEIASLLRRAKIFGLKTRETNC